MGRYQSNLCIGMNHTYGCRIVNLLTRYWQAFYSITSMDYTIDWTWILWRLQEIELKLVWILSLGDSHSFSRLYQITSLDYHLPKVIIYFSNLYFLNDIIVLLRCDGLNTFNNFQWSRLTLLLVSLPMLQTWSLQLVSTETGSFKQRLLWTLYSQVF